MQRHAPFADRQVSVVTKSEFRRSGFTGVHLRGADFHGWPTTAVLVEHVRAPHRRRRALRVLVLPGRRRGRALVRPRRPLLHRRAPGRRSARRRDPRRAARRRRAAGHRRPRSGQPRAGVVDRARRARRHDRRLRRRRAVPLPACARRRRQGAARRGRGHARATTRGSSRATGCSTRGGWARIPPGRRAAASATSCSRPATPSASSTPPSRGRPACARPTAR